MDNPSHTAASVHPTPNIMVTPETTSSPGTTLFFPYSRPQDLLRWIEPLLESEHGVIVNQNEWTGRMHIDGVPLEGVRIRPHLQLYPDVQSVAENWPQDCDSGGLVRFTHVLQHFRRAYYHRRSLHRGGFVQLVLGIQL
jgi:hypothetical protein